MGVDGTSHPCGASENDRGGDVQWLSTHFCLSIWLYIPVSFSPSASLPICPSTGYLPTPGPPIHEPAPSGASFVSLLMQAVIISLTLTVASSQGHTTPSSVLVLGLLHPLILHSADVMRS